MAAQNPGHCFMTQRKRETPPLGEELRVSHSHPHPQHTDLSPSAPLRGTWGSQEVKGGDQWGLDGQISGVLGASGEARQLCDLRVFYRSLGRVLGIGSTGGVFRLSWGEFRGSGREFGIPGFREARDHPKDQARDPSLTAPLGG